jgi:hypothetical protein
MCPHAPACIARGRALARLPPLGSASAARLRPATGRAAASARAAAPGQVEERERGKWDGAKEEAREKYAAGGEKDEGTREKRTEEKEN